MGIISGILGALDGILGDKQKQSESFERDSTTNTKASAQDLSPELLKSLESLFQSQVTGPGFGQSQDAISARLAQLSTQAQQPQFDVASFSKGVTDQAASAANLDLESNINAILSNSGGSETGNSMNSLLANKLRNQTAANLAGINQQATATGEQIRQGQQGQITAGIQGLSSTLSNAILELIKSTRGASNTGQSESKEHTEGTGNVSASQTTNPFSAFANIFGSFNNARTNA